MSTSSLESNRRRAKRAHRLGMALAAVLSAGLHALLLLGFNSSASSNPANAGAPAPEIAMELFAAVPEPAVQPEKPETEKEVDQPQEQTEGPAAASLPEPISTAVVNDITQVVRPSAPVMPRADAVNWTVPASQVRAQHKVPTETIFDPKDLDKKPQLVSQIAPAYPFELEKDSVGGLVVVHFVVDSRGKVRDLEVRTAPHPLLAKAVRAAVARWEFRAGIKNGRAVATDMELPVSFHAPPK